MFKKLLCGAVAAFMMLGCVSAGAADEVYRPDKAVSEITASKKTSGKSKLIPKLTAEKKKLPKSEALDFVKDMKIGWNLGNTFDASDCTWVSNEMDYESAWNGDKTTEKHIDMLKSAGFNTVRIPVSWHNHLSDSKKYTINKDWMKRVTEVVDYCIDRDMYVIINIHHDNSEKFLYPSKKYYEQSSKYVSAIWKQVAENFKNYDEHLIFESMNEPRLVGHRNEWWIDNNSSDCKEAIQCINKLNQTFVNTVRKTGGKNKTRYLTCPGYDASADGALHGSFVLPKDTVKTNKNKIMVTVHAYTPYNFCYGVTDKWSVNDSSDKAAVTKFMDQLYTKYTSKGTPVIIDEFGAMNTNDNLKARVEFASFYVASARARGLTCVWWDNNCFSGSGETFGLLNRKSCKWEYPEIVEAMMTYAE